MQTSYLLFQVFTEAAQQSCTPPPAMTEQSSHTGQIKTQNPSKYEQCGPIEKNPGNVQVHVASTQAK